MCERPSGLSDFFNCNIGTKQGCMLSPFLFVIFLNEFIDLLESANCKCIFVVEHVPNLPQLVHFTKCITYWLQILEMPDERYPRRRYSMLLHLHEAGMRLEGRHGQQLLKHSYIYMVSSMFGYTKVLVMYGVL
jgi:hypothetical protein